ncbi:hypothetical protein CAP31_01250 [Sulfuriferula sp. AH1]|uniref:DUF2971 domain-containing protein n=1 Tax=Sulfuriferula sp. AH1 TaxID=1985873 RepID=UPI000B3B41A9|nr:DUF2971 domain-containing protein [Sulfuriferula sp. AH1]ARU30439.1 hypothetical protein CAP31_01250 [Sulfuriferula sp. AH1]
MADDYTKDILLHFTTLKSAALIVHEGILKPGTFSRSNDLYENLRRLHAQPFIMEGVSKENYCGHSKEKSSLIDGLGNVRFLSFCKAQAFFGNKCDGGTHWYVSNEKLAFQKMWGQYADKFGGVCLIFDKEKLTQAGENGCANFERNAANFGAFDVEYKQKTPEIRTLDQLRALSNFEELQRYFSIKHADWEDEQEFRFLFSSPSDEKYVPPISLHESLIGVLLGEKNAPNLREDAYESAELGFVNLLIDKIQADLQRDFANFSGLDAYHFPDGSAYPLQFKELKRDGMKAKLAEVAQEEE